MELDTHDSRARFAAGRVARLATVGPDGQPHLVPVTFATIGDLVVTAVDHKPKRSRALRRLANIRVRPRVSLLVDHYSDDWDTLWWVRADGTARVVAPADGADGTRAAALDALAAKYPQYRATPPAGPMILVAVERWRGWAAAP